MLLQFTKKEKKIWEIIVQFHSYHFLENFRYIDENKLLNPNQSHFHPFDSCVNQLLFINLGIVWNLDCDPPNDTLAVFLDISKAFSQIPSLIFKFKSFGTSGDLLELIKNFLWNRFWIVVLNGQTSEQEIYIKYI